MKTALIIISARAFQDHEYSATRKELESAGIKVVVASINKGACYGTFGFQAQSDLSLKDVNVSDFDAVVFIGGSGTDTIRSSPYSTQITVQAFKDDKVVAAICWAPTILAKAGILQGKKSTCWVGSDDEFEMTTDKYLEQRGAIFMNKPLAIDGKIITANGPPAAESFGKAIVELLK